MSAVDDLVQLATFESCGTSKIILQTVSDKSVSLLMHTGRTARPDDLHKPAAIVFTLADVTLEAYLQTRQRFTDGNQASYAWSVVVGLCGHSSRMVEEYVSQALAAAEGFHRWCLAGGSDVTLNSRLQALHDRLAPTCRRRSASTPFVGQAGQYSPQPCRTRRHQNVAPAS